MCRIFATSAALCLCIACAPNAEKESTLEGALQDAEKFIALSDQDGDGALDREEFAASIAKNSPNEFPSDIAREAFEGYDANGDGNLTAVEMQALARQAWSEKN